MPFTLGSEHTLEARRKMSKAGIGRKQSHEHVQKRVASAMRNLALTVRQCVRCSVEFTPTAISQRYCSGRCWQAQENQKPYRQKSKRYKRVYFISPKDYAELLAAQGGVCAICGGENPSDHKLACDHDHNTGVVRGLLCIRCNTGLGLFRDDLALLQAAFDYLGGTLRGIRLLGGNSAT